ncbi:MAG TPA: hypothetical protein VL263_22080 [Vicinamibacterales bacterium]|nr:hypothetical protein [Vicinamibacterales bacterium]
MSRSAGRSPHSMLRVLAAALLLLSCAVVSADAQTAPGRPTLPSGGGISPFRGPGVRGTSFEAASLDQPGCPIHLSIEALRRTERGVTVTIRLANLVDGSITRQVVGAWVLVPDGTIRGYQKLESDRLLIESASRVTDLIIRTVSVMPNDIIVLAVEEARGEQPWRRDTKELQQEVRSAIAR